MKDDDGYQGDPVWPSIDMFNDLYSDEGVMDADTSLDVINEEPCAMCRFTDGVREFMNHIEDLSADDIINVLAVEDTDRFIRYCHNMAQLFIDVGNTALRSRLDRVNGEWEVEVWEDFRHSADDEQEDE